MRCILYTLEKLAEIEIKKFITGSFVYSGLLIILSLVCFTTGNYLLFFLPILFLPIQLAGWQTAALLPSFCYFAFE